MAQVFYLYGEYIDLCSFGEAGFSDQQIISILFASRFSTIAIYSQCI